MDQGRDEELSGDLLLQDYSSSSSYTQEEQYDWGMMEVGSESSADTSRYDGSSDLNSQPLGEMRVLNVSLWPRELEQGCWPADFKLSDHGLVECVFQVTLTPRPFIAKE